MNVWTSVTDQPLNLDDHIAFVAQPDCGAVVTFLGRVRNHDHGRTVTQLEYSSHPSASEVLAKVAAEQLASSGVNRIAVSHRVGLLDVGDDALVAAVAAPHRAQAFAAIASLVDEVKAQLPIWKKQDFVEGDSEWVNSP